MSILMVSVDLTAISCGECGGVYAIGERYRKQKYNEGSSWHCPYCQVSWGYSETEEERLRKKVAASEAALASERARHDQTQAALATERRNLSKAKREAARIKTRIHGGVCPDCNRTFTNLGRHMKTKHAKP